MGVALNGYWKLGSIVKIEREPHSGNFRTTHASFAISPIDPESLIFGDTRARADLAEF
jgi:hypothetical protein